VLKVSGDLPFRRHMGLGSVAASATAGLADAGERLAKVAAGRASGSGEAGDLAAGAAELTGARVQMAVSVAVMRATNEMLGTLLDVMA
jgi:hypothetical protein